MTDSERDSERCSKPHRLDELEWAGCAACAWDAYHAALHQIEDALGITVDTASGAERTERIVDRINILRRGERMRIVERDDGAWVLSEAERAKGFVRPVRRSYQHVGPPGPRFPLRDLTPDERSRYCQYGYAMYEAYPESEAPLAGRYWAQRELDAAGRGCGTITTMALAIAETYARDPRFYCATYCAGCGTYRTVGERGEFVWCDERANPTSQRVGT